MAEEEKGASERGSRERRLQYWRLFSSSCSSSSTRSTRMHALSILPSLKQT